MGATTQRRDLTFGLAGERSANSHAVYGLAIAERVIDGESLVPAENDKSGVRLAVRGLPQQTHEGRVPPCRSAWVATG